MNCNCPDETYVQSTVDNVVICTKTTIISDITCPPNCEPILQEDGNVRCSCIDAIAPETVPDITPIYFDNEDYFKDVSWTISYKVSEGTWNSYFSFYPDYSPFHNGFFQVGYNWGEDKETVWNHLFKNSSFGIFQGKKHTPIIEFPIVSENVNKMLNSIALNIEPRHYQNDYDYSIDKDKSFKNLYIYNSTNNTGMLGLNPQKTLADSRKYPKLNGNVQDILFTSDEGKQNINYLFNRVVDQNNNIPLFNKDENNLFKQINTNAVKFQGNKILERMKGEYFTVHLEGLIDSRYNLILKNIINDETITE